MARKGKGRFDDDEDEESEQEEEDEEDEEFSDEDEASDEDDKKKSKSKASKAPPKASKRKQPAKAQKSRKRSEFLDEAAEEDDDEDEDDEEDGTTRRKRARANPFIDDTAAVAESDEEEEEEDAEDLIDDRDADLPGSLAEPVSRVHQRMDMRNREEDNDEEIQKFIEERYGSARYQEMDDAERSEVEQQGLFPSVKDPKLWMVGCKTGHEREGAACLMQKFLDKAAAGEPLLIKSAIALDHLKGYVYVEAYAESHVRSATTGLRMFYYKPPKLVPIREMVDVLNVNAKDANLQEGSWIRIRNGTYKGDLGQVLDVDYVRQRCTVKLVPRLDFAAIAAKADDKDYANRKRPRPPQRLFNAQDAKDLGLPLDRRRDNITGDYHEIFANQRFNKGYVIKIVSLKSCNTKDISPTYEELQKFQGPDGEGGGMDLAGMSKALPPTGQQSKVSFVKGDTVVVIEGDLISLKAKVEQVDGDEVTISAKDGSLKEAVSLSAKQLRKHFDTGDHVKVLAGRHESETGMVVHVHNNVLVILSDVSMKNIEVFARDVVECTEVTGGFDTFGNFQLHDLVLLDNSSFGMIIKVEKEACQVLTNNGTPDRPDIRTVRLPEIQRKLYSKKYTTQDAYMNTIAVDDVVRIVDGAMKNKTGTVRHIQKGFLFLQSREVIENQGIVCVRAKLCRALGGQKTTNAALPAHGNGMFVPQSPARFMTPSRMMGGMAGSMPSPTQHGTPGRQGGFGRGGGFQGNGMGRGHHTDPIIGKSLKIKSGPWKGYTGRVVDATDSTVRLELESQMRTVSVRRDQLPVAPARDEKPQHQQQQQGWGRSSHGRFGEYPQTPARDYTPMGSRTPARDTPSYMKTPVRETPTHTIDQPYHPYRPTTPVRDSDYEMPGGWGNSPGGPIAGYKAAETPYNMYPPFTPSEHAPVGTPGMDHNPGTPGARAYDAQTPWNAPTPGMAEARSPYPGQAGGYGMPSTPGGYNPGTANYNPATPSTPGFTSATTVGYNPATPSTPGAGALDIMSPGMGGAVGAADLRPMPGILVIVDRPSHERQTGVVRAVQDNGSCTVALGEKEQTEEITVSVGDLELVPPKKHDKVKVLAGDLRGHTGKLIGIDASDGIVKLDENLDIKILDISSLGKLLVT
eukprot:jgi/Chlat1/3574/Chrsp234S03564